MGSNINDLIQRARSLYNPNHGESGLNVTETWGQEDDNLLFLGDDDPTHGNDNIHINTDYGGFIAGLGSDDNLTMEGTQAEAATANLGIYGGAGNDVITSLFKQAAGIMELFGGAGNDTINLNGSGNRNVLVEMLQGNDNFNLQSGSTNNMIKILLGLGRNLFHTDANTTDNTIKFLGEYAADDAGPLENTGLGTAEDKATLAGTHNTFQGHTSDGADHLAVSGQNNIFDLSLGHGADDITFTGTGHAGRINLNRVLSNGDIADDDQADVLDLSQAKGFTLSVAAGENDVIRLSEGGWTEAERGVDQDGNTINASPTAKIYKKTEADGSVSTLIVYNISGDGADPTIQGAGQITQAGVADIVAESDRVNTELQNRENRVDGGNDLPADESTDAAAIITSGGGPVADPEVVEDNTVTGANRTAASDYTAVQLLSQLASTDRANTGGVEDYAWDAAEIDGLIAAIENDQLDPDMIENFQFLYLNDEPWADHKQEIIASLRYIQSNIPQLSQLGWGSEVTEAEGKFSDMDGSALLHQIEYSIYPNSGEVALTLDQVVAGQRRQ